MMMQLYYFFLFFVVMDTLRGTRSVVRKTHIDRIKIDLLKDEILKKI